MSLEEFNPDIESPENWWNSAEISGEVSEKFKESVKKATSWIWRTQRDEKKAKKYDLLLASFLVQIILDKRYDKILESLFRTMDYWYTSNFVLWVVSLINIEISNKIRDISNKKYIVFNYKSVESIEFDDNNLPFEIKNRINYWIEDIIDSIIIEYSNIQTKRVIKLLEKDSKIINYYIANVFTFFLDEINIKISNNKALNISDFIITEINKSIKNIELKEV